MSCCGCDKHPDKDNLRKGLFGLGVWVTVQQQQEHKAAESEVYYSLAPSLHLQSRISARAWGPQWEEDPAHFNRVEIIPYRSNSRVIPDSVKETTNNNCNSVLMHISTNTSMTALNVFVLHRSTHELFSKTLY